jgi:hypothetical protein
MTYLRHRRTLLDRMDFRVVRVSKIEQAQIIIHMVQPGDMGHRIYGHTHRSVKSFHAVDNSPPAVTPYCWMGAELGL